MSACMQLVYHAVYHLEASDQMTILTIMQDCNNYSYLKLLVKECLAIISTRFVKFCHGYPQVGHSNGSISTGYVFLHSLMDEYKLLLH